MRIAHVTSTFPPYQGGTGNVCYHDARELARRGHEVHVFTARIKGAAVEELIEGVHVHRLRPLVQIGNAPLLPQLIWRLRGFDLIHLHYPFILGAEAIRLNSLKFRVPLIISLHNDLIGDGSRAGLFATYRKFSARFTVRHAAMLCAVSLDHYHDSLLCRELNGQEPRVTELPNGVDIDRFRPQGSTDTRDKFGIPDEAHLLLFVAALDRAHHFKGLGRLLEAMTYLSDNVWLLIVGDGELRRSYENLSESLQIAQRVVFVGAISHTDTPPFYRTADVIVLPSSPPESFGLVLIESMACGTPVIASDIPGVRTVVSSGRDGYLVEPGNVADLAEKIRAILALSDADRKEMGLAGRRKVEERYSWELIGDRLEALYQDVLLARSQRAGRGAKAGAGT
jgi:glycosyltransferase involved in cell wall biosynthesis